MTALVIGGMVGGDIDIALDRDDAIAVSVTGAFASIVVRPLLLRRSDA